MKVSDFGFAAKKKEGESDMFNTVLGTDQYMVIKYYILN
jgi:hypothetical protein